MDKRKKIAGIYETEEQARQAVATFRKNNREDLADALEELITIYRQSQQEKE